MEEEMRGIIAESPAECVGAAFHSLADGRETLICPDEPFHAASTMKLPVMMEAFRLAHEGRLSLDDRIPIRNAFISMADGSPYSLNAEDDSDRSLYGRIGETESIRELVRIMIQVSGNLATNLLIDLLTPEAVNALCRGLGAPDVVVRRGVMDMRAFERGQNSMVTARGLMMLYLALARGNAASREADLQMIDVLLGQQHRDGIPAGLPAGVPVAHKTGWFSGVHHDSGIVYPPGAAPYVLVVLTRGIEKKARSAAVIADMSRAAYLAAVGA